MINVLTVPLYIIEEHHEAFYIWNYACFKGFIRPFGNTLLHVDSHEDMGISRLNESVDELEENLNKIYDFVYRELGIASFIMPAIYRGIINQYVHLCRYDYYQGKKVWQFIASWQGKGKYFDTGEVKPLLRKHIQAKDHPWSKHQFFSCQEIGLAGSYSTGQPLILDIDLDYFSCDNSLSSVKSKIEITQEAYLDFTQNKYHPLRIMPAAIFSAGQEDGGRYYLYYMERQEEKDLKKVSLEMIDKRIDGFLNFLRRNQLKPGLIDICRSRYSGYTPGDQWQYIEEKLLDGLSSLYNLQMSHISELKSGREDGIATVSK